MKKIIAIVLAAVLLFGSTVSVAAQEEKAITPLVIVRGMDFGGLIIDQGLETERPALQVEVMPLVFGIFKMLGLAVFCGMDGLVDGLIDVVDGIFEPLTCDGNGNSVENISVKEYPKSMANYPEALESFIGSGGEEGIVAEACERYGAENVYYVTYDWRLDPYETAAKINERVNLAVSDGSCEKVRIICCSLGGVMTQAYFDEYGYDKVESCMFLSSAIYGSYCSSDPFAGKVGFDKEILNNFLGGVLPELNVLWKILDFTGITDALIGFANNLTADYGDKIYGELMSVRFGGFAGLWGMQQTDDFEAAKELFFGGREDEYAGVISKIDKFQQYRLKRDSFLKQMQADGVEISIVCSYDKPVVPVYEHSYVNGDQVLETELMSAGATVAPYGKTLGDSYVASDPTKLSPDRVVDASTCLFPEYTWFIKGAPHVPCQYGSEIAEMLFYILDFDGQPTVTSTANYPQFQYCDEEQNLYKF